MTWDHFKRHRDDGIIDEVTIRLVPRFKTSGLSGNEWRVSAVTTLKRKGSVMYERGYQSVNDAATHLPWLLRTWTEMPDSEIQEWTKQIERDKGLCHQPGCSAKATGIFALKKEFSREGFVDPRPVEGRRALRAFCKRHAERGDASLEDRDENYECVGGTPAAEPNPRDESPASFGGVIDLTKEPDEA